MASSNLLVLKQQTSGSHDTLVYVACECFLAAVECMLMAQIWDKVGRGKYSGLDVYKSRMDLNGDVDHCATWVVQHSVPQRRSVAEARLNSGTFYRYHTNYGINNNATGARPKANSNSTANHNDSGILRPSRSGLTSPSSQRKTRESRDSGYGSKSTSKELPDMIPGRESLSPRNRSMDEISPEELYGHGSQVCDNSLAQLNIGMHSLDLRHGHQGHTGGSTNNDIFEARTMDDHLRHSQNFVQRIDKQSSSQGPPGANQKPQSYDEWSDVRDKLRMEYGDRYFEGEGFFMLDLFLEGYMFDYKEHTI